MTTEPPTKKPWDPPIIKKEEWAANQAQLKAVKAEQADFLRKKIKDGITSIVGRHPDPRIHTVKMTKWLIKNGLLTKPSWNINSTLTLDHFPTEDLIGALTTLKLGYTPKPKEETDDDTDTCPF
jgi:hypothetical protein